MAPATAEPERRIDFPGRIEIFLALADTQRSSRLKAGKAMSEKSSGGIEFTPKTQDVPDMAPNPSNLPTEEQKEKPKQNGRFIIAMIPAKKKPLPESPTEKTSPS